MATTAEKDTVTGVETTGHEWDGVRELNNPLPTWWLWTFYASILFAVVYMILYPSVPGLSGHFGGVLGYNSRTDVAAAMASADAARAQWTDRIAALEPADIADDPDLRSVSLVGGAALFADNCAPCHGQGGAGRPGGYPSLADDDWLWGGDHAAIQHSITWGVRNETDETRYSEMPRFGDGLLDRAQIEDVADHVLSLSGRSDNAAAAARGAAVYAEQCAVCHGDDGLGAVDFGAPRLSDAIWLYGGSRAAVIAQISRPRQGVMPAWGQRLSETDVKMLTVYVHALGGGE